MSKRAGEEFDSYSGKVGEADTDGVDTAYRLLADHMRMISVTNAPGSQLGPGHEGREYFLKCADKLAVQYCHKVLEILEQDRYAVIVFTSLLDSDLCPELGGYRKKDQIEEDEVMIYPKTIREKKRKKGATSVVWYATRIIEFLGRRTPIVLKNKNTRCSLVALCNVLLLGEKITLNLDIKKVSEGHLIYLVQSYLLYGNTQMQLEQNLELSEFNKQVLGVLPKLPGSLYFDVKFASSCGFEQTLETALFGCLGVPLHHGWMVDRQDVELGSSIHRSCYFRLAVTLAMYESLLPEHQKYDVGCKDDMFYSALAFSSAEPEELTGCARISTFLRGPQLTPYGFSSLKNDLEERQPSLLLWNETLLTVSKVEDQIYVLLNDISLLSTHTDAVWERLREGNDDGYFVDRNFMPTNSLIQSILPLTKNERKTWKKKAEMGLKGRLLPKEKEEDRNDDKKEDRNEDRDYEKNEEKDDEKNEEKDDEKTEEKDDGKTEEKGDGKAEEEDENIQEKAIISGMRGNLNMRPIDFFGRSTHIIHQINDGPCALIAAYSPEIRRQIWDVAPKLAEGFDMNVVFNRTDGFTVTPEWLLLDCLDLNIRHGWIPNVDLLPGPEVPEVSYERLTLKSLEPGCPDAETIKNFLNGHQLTLIGLVSLLEDLGENIPCILYCHYHYSTIVKVNGVIYSLVININYLRTPAVWQMLEVNGGGVYLDSKFRPIYMWLDAAPSGSFSVPETSTSEASTSFMKPDSEGITSHGDRLGLDSFTQLHSGPDTAPLRDNLHASWFVPKIRTRRSCTNSMRPYIDKDMSNEKSVPGPQIVPGTREISLEEFVLIPGNEFSKSRTIFAGGTSLNVADTTRTGRVLGLDFDLSTIYVVDGVRAEIRAPYCEKFCEKAKFNDYFSYICNIVELFKIEGIGLPAFFTQLVRLLSDPPLRPSGCNIAQLEGYRRRLHGFWDCVLTTLALRSSSARSGLFNGIRRIRRSAPLRVRSKLREILARHPVLKKVLGYIPGDGSDEEAKEKEPEDKKFGFFTPDSSEEAKEKEPEDQKFGLFTLNEHAKSKEDLELEWRKGVVKEPFNKLSELELLTSHYLEDELPVILEALL
ncbi:hypothetical protein PAHAL_6G074700 [Panicum hallii]|uniref:MINDY deubiquitinase domain-containing protein n=1 Tax=Panicum hallii TaxID=206008 RepID=A0A2T8IFJ1_9POAL|nr:hypothetical protein PAHAL_6G074700 [Panicum hallii]